MKAGAADRSGIIPVLTGAHVETDVGRLWSFWDKEQECMPEARREINDKEKLGSKVS